MKHAVMTVCKQEGAIVFSTGDGEDLAPVIDRYHSKGIRPLLVFDAPAGTEGGLTGDEVGRYRRRAREAYPHLATAQFVSRDDHAFSLRSYADGVRAVIPAPSREAGKETYVEDVIGFLEVFRSYAGDFFQEQEKHDLGSLKVFLRDLSKMGK